MNYIVLDLEWNSPMSELKKVSGMPFEIIEIGAVKLDSKLNVVSSFDHYIKPQVYKELSPVIKGLIHVNADRLKNGEAFADVYEKFISWCGEDYLFCTWGDMDLTELQRNMRYYGIENTFPKPFIFLDIQKLFALATGENKSRRKLESASESLKLGMKKEFHNALNDAHYTAMVMKKIDFERVKGRFSVDTFRIPESREEEHHIRFDTYEKYISKGYASKEEILADSRVLSNRCYICGNLMKKYVNWFSNSNRIHYYVGKCREHGFIKEKLRIKKTDDDKYFAIRIMKATDEEGVQKVKDKKKTVKKVDSSL